MPEHPPSTAPRQPPPPQSDATSDPATKIPDTLKLDPSCLLVDADAVLGAGSFGTVLGGTYTFPVHGATPVAIKVFNGTAGDRAGRNEAGALAELMASTRVSVHPYLVQMYGAVRIPKNGLCLVMERIAGQSLRVVLDATAEQLPWELRSRWLHEVAQGMEAMHRHKPHPVLHRDLKASNVLLDSGDVAAAHAKIADFGVARAIDELVVDTYSRGAMEWTAPETLDGRVSFPSDVYSYGILIYEVLTRLMPFHNTSGAEKNKLVSLQRDLAQFEYDSDDDAYDASQQRSNWARKRTRTFVKRRPDMELLGKDSPAVLVALMQACWRDEASERPQFGNVVAQLVQSVGGGGGGGGKGKGKSGRNGGGHSERGRQASKVSIYTIARDVFQKTNADLAAEGMKRETASEIFKNELAGTLERLFKEVVTQYRLPIPAGKAPGLGTYYRTVRDAMRSGPHSDSAFFDAPGVMDEFCSQRNLAVHHDVHLPVPTIRQHALTCSKVLDALKASYPL